AERNAPTFRSASPIAELLRLAGPTVVQMASYTVMQFIDTWMLSRVGPTTATAGGNAAMLSFSLLAFGIGVLWVVNTLASQSFGAGDCEGCGEYLWQGVWFAILFGAAALIMLPAAPHIFRLMHHPPLLARLETRYFRIVIPAAAIKLTGVAFQQFLLATDRPRRVMISSTVGIAANAVAAAALIFGVHWGNLHIPSLGVAGSAWGQNIGVTVESGLAILLTIAPAQRRLFPIHRWHLNRHRLAQLLRIGTPTGLQLVSDVLAWTLFSLSVIAPFGTDAMAGNTFMMRYMVVSFMPAFGVSNAVTALVGRYLGAARPDIAAARVRLAFRLTAAYMLACGAIFFLARHALIGLFTRDPTIQKIGGELLIFAAIYQFFDAMYIIYNAALLGSGDTLIPSLATGILCWGVTVTGGYAIARHLPQLGPAGPWIAATAYGIILGIFMLLRFRWARKHDWQRWVSVVGIADPGPPASTTPGTI
ncbi:MAG TPA: MATE family efflux transporter, partial [Tepidisphaeraceae bacterium]|nr:MATE family efflux transporter [Tepidisphaeraceae bacterium]